MTNANSAARSDAIPQQKPHVWVTEICSQLCGQPAQISVGIALAAW